MSEWGTTHDQIGLNLLSGLEDDLTGVRFWEGLYNIVQDEVDVPGLELGSDHLAKLDGVCLVKDKGVTVDNGNLLGLRGEEGGADKGTEITIRRESLPGIRLSAPRIVLKRDG